MHRRIEKYHAILKRFGARLHLYTWKAEEDQAGGPGVSSPLEELAEACRHGDRASERRLFLSLAPKMMSLCMRYVGDRATAEDLLQEGFVTLFTRLDSYSGKGSFEGWARKIFVNTALMYLRKTDALKLSNDIDMAFGVASEDVPVVGQISYKELLGLISKLPSDARTVFNMYVIEGYSHKDIADALGITEVTSRSKLQRARVRLQEMINKRR